MPILLWDESYSVGVAELDDQHKELIRMLNELHHAMTNDRGQEVVGDIVAEMNAYADRHFRTEESYMRRFKYLGYMEHRREHEKFTDKARELQTRSSSGEFVLSFEVVRFLSDWLKAHILETDRKYLPLFRENGLR